MPKYLIELDLIIGYTSISDRLHNLAISIMTKVKEGEFGKVLLPASVLLEYSLYLKSRKIKLQEVEEVIVTWQQFPNIAIIELNGVIIASAINLQSQYGLSYFDSLHVATAIHEKASLIGTDGDFKKVKRLSFVDAEQFAKSIDEEEMS